MWRCVTPASNDFQAPLRRGFSFALLHLEQGFSFFSALPAAHSQPDFKALFTAFLLRRYRILPAVKRALWVLAGVGACTAQYSRIQPSTAQDVPRPSPTASGTASGAPDGLRMAARPLAWIASTARGQRLPCQALPTLPAIRDAASRQATRCRAGRKPEGAARAPTPGS